jgi:DNA sulfur modification protein DndD
MIINKIKLNNFGIFKGQHEIDLTPKNDKPVVLFGALNGSGKTTLLEGIQIALYGQSSKVGFRGKKNYLHYLKSMINHHIEENENTFLEITFTENIEGSNQQFILKREWKEIESEVKESLSIHNEAMFNGKTSERVDEFIEDIMPSSISNLFFFDGEKIESLALPEQSKHIIRDGIYSLLGIHSISDLISSLNIFERRKISENVNDEEIQIINRSDKKIEDLENKMMMLKQEKSASLNQLDDLNKKLNDNAQQLKNNGYEVFKRRDNIRQENIELEQQKNNIYSDLRDLAFENTALVMVEKQINELRGELINSSGFNASNINLLHDEFEAIKTIANDASVNNYIVERLNTLKKSIENMSYDIDLNLIPNDSFFNQIKHQNQELNKQYENLLLKIKNNDKQLKAIPEEDQLKQFIETELELTKKIQEHEINIRAQEQRIDEIRIELDRFNIEKANILKSLSEKQVKNDMDQIILAKSKKSRQTLERYKNNLVQKQIKNLENLITDSYASMQRKEDRLLQFQILPDTFTLIINENDKEVDVTDLSAGEKQLVAISILWALTKSSPKSFPSLIDTPLARLDSEHRQNIVKNYFPKTSDQVLIFSTDEEVYGKHYQVLKDSISHEYLINFDGNSKSSHFKSGYFNS